MIVYFPDIYPDELVYSLLARFYSKSGHLAYIFAAQDLYINKANKPDIEFLNPFTDDTLQIITKHQSMEDIVMHHTMFPYYGRFVERERKVKAFDALVKMSGEYRNLLPIPKSQTKGIRYLRYCPSCVVQDRNTYGETYWHRIHQLIGVDICPIHHCYLINSDIPINSMGSPALLNAEESVIIPNEVAASCNPMECMLAEYISEVFYSVVDLHTQISIGAFLHSRLEETKYLSQHGNLRNMALLHSDFMEYYNSLGNNPLNQQWQLGKVFSSYRHSTYEICMVALFLNIAPNDLVKMTLPEKSQQNRFDDMVFYLHNQGLNYRQIANKMNASYDTVKAIGEGLYGTYHYPSKLPNPGKTKKKNWEQIDKDRLPEVKNTIAKLWGNEMERPQKITVGLIERKLGLSKKGLKKCPLCMAEIEKYAETQEQYWIRELQWAIRIITMNGQSPTWTRIKQLTEIRKENMLSCLPYLEQSNKTELLSIVREILSKFN